MVAEIGGVMPMWDGREAVPLARQPEAAKELHPTAVHFVRDQDSGRVAVKIVDEVTGEELNSIPSEKMLATLAVIRKAVGLLLDHRH